MNTLISKSIYLVRFPLLVLVIFVHANFGKTLDASLAGMAIAKFVMRFISEGISSVAVPCFFVISGYLFFNQHSLNWQLYLSKLKSRIHTLLIPYILWNALTLCVFYLVQSYFPSTMSGQTKLLANWNVSDFVFSFWDMQFVNGPDVGISAPICAPLWYVRNLMLLALASPIVYTLVVRFKHWLILCLLVIWFVNPWDYSVNLAIQSYLFFSVGTYLALCQPTMSCIRWPLQHMWTIYLLLLVGGFYIPVLWKIAIVVGIIVIARTTMQYVSGIDKGAWSVLSNSSFFLYAFHQIPLTVCIKLLTKLIGVGSLPAVMTTYFISPLLTICVGVVLYSILAKRCPRLSAWLNGSR